MKKIIFLALFLLPFFSYAKEEDSSDAIFKQITSVTEKNLIADKVQGLYAKNCIDSGKTIDECVKLAKRMAEKMVGHTWQYYASQEERISDLMLLYVNNKKFSESVILDLKKYFKERDACRHTEFTVKICSM